MKKIYEDKDVLIVDSENNDVVNPIYVFYESKIIQTNYDFELKAFPSLIESIIYNELQRHAKEVFKNKRYICLDCETTGLEPSVDEILSLSIVNQDGVVLFNEKFKPDHHTSWEQAEQIHGITPSMVENKKSISHYISEIRNILNQYYTILGYNVSFDLKFLSKNVGFNFVLNEVIDVMSMFAPIYGERFKGGYKWQSLETCADYYDYEYFAHDSLEDVKATIYCYNKIMKEKLGIED